MSDPAAGPPPLGPIAAPHTLGYMLNTMLYGILLLQTYLYYVAFPKDKLGIKVLVYGLFLLETLQTAFMMSDAMHVLGLGFGDPLALIHVHLAWLSVPILSSMVSCIVQCFFAWRIYVLSQSIIVAAIIALMAWLQFGAGIAQGVFSYIINDFSALPNLPLGIWLITAAVCDVVIAVFMAYNLQKKTTGFQKTDVLLTRLTRMTIETGTATAIMAIITAVLFLALPGINYFVTPSYVLGKLYVNNLMMIFNSRLNIVGSRNGAPSAASQATYSQTGQGSTLQGSSFGGGGTLKAGDRMPVQVSIQRDISHPGQMEMNDLESAKGGYGGGARQSFPSAYQPTYTGAV